MAMHQQKHFNDNHNASKYNTVLLHLYPKEMDPSDFTAYFNPISGEKIERTTLDVPA